MSDWPTTILINLRTLQTNLQDRDNIIKYKTKQIRKTDSQQAMHVRIIFLKKTWCRLTQVNPQLECWELDYHM